MHLWIRQIQNEFHYIIKFRAKCNYDSNSFLYRTPNWSGGREFWLHEYAIRLKIPRTNEWSTKYCKTFYACACVCVCEGIFKIVQNILEVYKASRLFKWLLTNWHEALRPIAIHTNLFPNGSTMIESKFRRKPHIELNFIWILVAA